MAQDSYDIVVYYFPNYHADARNAAVHGSGWSEWELVKRAEPRYPGHQQPKVPLWGYEDEADPAVFARKIAAAADHGITTFLFDWYHYNDGPFLARALDEGYLAAANNDRLRFALMWANHNWRDIHPAKRHGQHKPLYPGAVTHETFDRVADLVIGRYFGHPSYWKIEGRAYFSIYDLATLIEGLGGVAATAEALRRFRDKTRAAGFPDRHLNAVVFGVRILPGEQALQSPNAMIKALGFDSVTSYVWVHHVRMPEFPTTSYEYLMPESVKYWHRAVAEFGVPFHPNVTMGWDPSPRTVQSDVYANVGYPFSPILVGNTPDKFKHALEQARAFLDGQGAGHKILTINAWNEWTEGSYLEPDTVHGMAYLEAIRDVFA
jgi:hypothetical protein